MKQGWDVKFSASMDAWFSSSMKNGKNPDTFFIPPKWPDCDITNTQIFKYLY